MPSIEVLKTGHLDERDSAYPQAVQLPDGDILCSFSVGGGPNVHGGTDWARSTDGGQTWPAHSVVFEDPQKKLGYFEQKLAEVSPGRVMANRQ